MRTIHILLCVFLFSHFSMVFAEDDFSKLEKDFLRNPSGVEQSIEEQKIISRIRKKTVQEALATQFQIIRPHIQAEVDKSDEFKRYLKYDKEGIKVYLFTHKRSKLGTFKAISRIRASIDSILAVMFDNPLCAEWVHSCGQSFVLENVSFSERYHYQTFHLPFPFSDRDFIFHSIMTQNPRFKTINITMFGVPNYCDDKQSAQCKKVNKSKLVRVKKTIGTYLLEPDSGGTKITWIQYTDPEGNIPKWLVNQFSADTPYWTLKNLAQMVKQVKYKNARLSYNNQGMAVALYLAKQNAMIHNISPKKMPRRQLTVAK